MPDDLPSIPDPVIEEELEETGIDKARYCKKCGDEARIVSNYLGVAAHCGQCRTSWPIAGPNPNRSERLVSHGRGISKRVVTPQTIDLDEMEPPPEDPEEFQERRRRRRKYEDG